VLNELETVNVLSLRAGYFYSNLLLSLDLVKTAGHMGNMFAIPDGTFTVVDPGDIARVAAQAFDMLNFKGHSYVYVISDLWGGRTSHLRLGWNKPYPATHLLPARWNR
jgi:hypothetical protein